jgi:hypothetical protein
MTKSTWAKIPLTAKILVVLFTAFVGGGTTALATAEFHDLPDRVTILEEEQQDMNQMLRYLVCRSRTENAAPCDYILPEAVYDAPVR